MQHLKKIKKMKDSQASKELAMTEMLKFKQSQLQAPSQTSSFISEEKSSFLKRKKNQNAMFTIKNLDENKTQLIDKEEKVTHILEHVDELPELETLLEKLWSQYLSEKQKEEEEFLEACYQGNVQRVRKVLKGKSEHPIDPNKTVNSEGKNGIHLATVSGSYRRTEIISELVRVGVDINGRTFLEKRTPLMLGCILGNEIAVKSLLENEANVDLTDYEGNTALHFCFMYNHEDIVPILMDFNPKVQMKNEKGYLALDYSKLKQGGETKASIVTQRQQQQPQNTSDKPKPVSSLTNMLTKLSEKQAELEEKQTNFESNSHNDLSLIKRITGTGERIKNVSIKDTRQQSTALANFKKISVLGKGAFGQVYLVENTLDGSQYAMKALDKATIMQQNILRYAMTERKILSTINHPFVVKLHYAFQSENKLFLVMDYCPGGDMLKMIKKMGTIEETIVRSYTAELILAIQALHKAEIIYRDLKPGNVIFDENGHACLTDFGLSKEAALSHSFCGSTAYLAPEMLWRRGHTKVLDWYLLGVLIYECLTGRPPFWDTNKQQLFSNIKGGRYKPLPNTFSKEVKDLVQKLLKSNSNKRLGAEGAEQIKKHAWFKGINWKDVEQKKLKVPVLETNRGKPIRNNEAFNEHTESLSNSIKGWDYSKD